MTLVTLAVAILVGVGVGWALTRRLTPQQRHDRAVAEFVEANRLQPVRPTTSPDEISVILQGVRLRFAGHHPDGADVYVNDQPLPDVDVVHIEGMPDDTTVVIVESRR